MAPRKLLNGSNYGGTTYASGSTTATNFILSDGSMITLNFVTTDGIWVGIDTNGIKNLIKWEKIPFCFCFLQNMVCSHSEEQELLIVGAMEHIQEKKLWAAAA